MTDQTEKRYENELTIDDLDKIAGGWHDLPKNAPPMPAHARSASTWTALPRAKATAVPSTRS